MLKNFLGIVSIVLMATPVVGNSAARDNTQNLDIQELTEKLLVINDKSLLKSNIQSLYVNLIEHQKSNKPITPQESLSYPESPYVQIQKSRTEYISTGVNLGLALGQVSGKISRDYRYSITTTLTLLTGMQTNSLPRAQSIKTDAGLNMSNNSQELIWYDKKSGQAFPKLSNSNPMLGLCTYEASLGIETGKELNLEVLGSGASVGQGVSEDTSVGIVSELFQITPGKSVNDYLHNECGSRFVAHYATQDGKSVRDIIESNFSILVLDALATQNPENQCNPPQVQSDSTPKGDVSCFAWHQKNFKSHPNTIARCEMGRLGNYSCRIKAKEQEACTLFYDSLTQNYTVQKKHNLQYLATAGLKEFACDEQQGLTCQMQREPKFYKNFPYEPGQARCIKSL